MNLDVEIRSGLRSEMTWDQFVRRASDLEKVELSAQRVPEPSPMAASKPAVTQSAPPNPKTGGKEARQCFTCQGFGHFARQCPSSRPGKRVPRGQANPQWAPRMMAYAGNPPTVVAPPSPSHYPMQGPGLYYFVPGQPNQPNGFPYSPPPKGNHPFR